MTRYEKFNLLGIIGLLGSALVVLLSNKAFHMVFGVGFLCALLAGMVYTFTHPEERT